MPGRSRDAPACLRPEAGLSLPLQTVHPAYLQTPRSRDPAAQSSSWYRSMRPTQLNPQFQAIHTVLKTEAFVSSRCARCCMVTVQLLACDCVTARLPTLPVLQRLASRVRLAVARLRCIAVSAWELSRSNYRPRRFLAAATYGAFDQLGPAVVLTLCRVTRQRRSKGLVAAWGRTRFTLHFSDRPSLCLTSLAVRLLTLLCSGAAIGKCRLVRAVPEITVEAPLD